MVAKLVHKSASVTLRPLPEGDAVWVANLYATERRQGHATELMQKVVDKADEQNMTLILDARAYGHPLGMPTGPLIIFYEEFGFVDIPAPGKQPGKHLMRRNPNQKIHLYCSIPGHREGWVDEGEGVFWCPDCESTHKIHSSQE